MARPTVWLIAAVALFGLGLLLTSGQVWLLIIFGPPLILAAVGLILVAGGRPLPGALLALIGLGQLALTFVSFSACTPFDSDPCHAGTGSWWDYWPEVVIGWIVAVSALLASGVFGLVRELRAR